MAAGRKSRRRRALLATSPNPGRLGRIAPAGPGSFNPIAKIKPGTPTTILSAAQGGPTWNPIVKRR
jgi:hypothetical protein